MAARLTRLCRRTTSIFLQPHRTLTGSPTEDTPPVLPQKREVNKAMKAYLERANEHELFMKVQNYEFQIGKRHLANMMGENPETFSQADVDNAIEYLFPSGLYEKKARPFMKPPEEVFPKRKAAEFNEHGKPHHYLFYTGKPNFYKVMYDIVENMNESNKFEDVMLRKNKLADPNLKLELSGYKWVECHVLANQLVENITEKEYDNFIVAMERLSVMPYAYKYKEFILNYMRPLMTQSSTYEVPKLHYDATGRGYITTYECVRKRAKGHVTLSTPGSGKITINGQDITYFEHLQNREQLLFPLIFADMLGKVDVEAFVEKGGPSGQAGAIRWGIAWGLRSFVDMEMIEKMRLAGLLSKDFRTRERKKPGQQGARRKFTWKKR